MELKLDFNIDPFKVKMEHGDQCILIGSCFSNEMGAHFEEKGFDVLSNPFGTVFHPEAISRLVSETIEGVRQERVFQRNDLFFSWDAGGTVFGYSEAELKSRLERNRAQLLDYLKNSKYLFVTFGSAFGYTANSLKQIVANCHKMPSSDFTKSMTDTDSMVHSWSKTLNLLFKLNPQIQVVFTVSPVRHVKDGLIANNRSKSRLFELISELEKREQTAYFPSYEIVMDELRDYRFYKSDGIHPNELAVGHVWKHLGKALFSAETQMLCTEIMNLRNLENHRSLYPESIEHLKFIKKLELKIQTFLEMHPEIKWK